MRNIRLTIEFSGAGYHGWQFQPDRPTVQGEIETALRNITGAPTRLYGCSRTDAGVSARNYVANFHSDSDLAPERLRCALNFHLPGPIHVKLAEPVDEAFHARYDARSKLYLYRLVRGYSPLRHARAWELRYPMDVKRMRRVLTEFTGTRDFQPFCLTRDKSGRCMIFRLDLSESGDELELLIRGDRFLYKMVRRIVGATVNYGYGRLTLRDIRAALAGRKHRPYRTAPAAGLLLDSVEY